MPHRLTCSHQRLLYFTPNDSTPHPPPENLHTKFSPPLVRLHCIFNSSFFRCLLNYLRTSIDLLGIGERGESERWNAPMVSPTGKFPCHCILEIWAISIHLEHFRDSKCICSEMYPLFVGILRRSETWGSVTIIKTWLLPFFQFAITLFQEISIIYASSTTLMAIDSALWNDAPPWRIGCLLGTYSAFVPVSLPCAPPASNSSHLGVPKTRGWKTSGRLVRVCLYRQ